MVHETLGGVGDNHSRRTCSILTTLGRKLSRMCSRIRWLVRRRPRLKLIIVKGLRIRKQKHSRPHRNRQSSSINFSQRKPVRIATFNVAMFSLAPAVPKGNNSAAANMSYEFGLGEPRSILKQSPLHIPGNAKRSNLKVSINLPDNEISLANNKFLSLVEDQEQKGTSPILFTRSKVPVRSPICFPYMMGNFMMRNSSNGEEEDKDEEDGENLERGGRLGGNNVKSILEVLREVNADILGLQDVKAEEEKGMRPLSDLAGALGMHYVFAESWAPQYGNAVLSRWPIKRWRAQKIADDDDFRNVLKATIEVPGAGELNFNCTQLDHLDEYWRMRQIRAIVQSFDPPHILAGGLNSLDESDYSTERWMDIVKYYEDIGKPTPKVEVMKFLNAKQYVDAKHSAGDCEPVVIIAKGQNVQGTCKYGTRVDYVLASPYSPFMFVPNSYSVISSKGTSDHHIVKVDVVRVDSRDESKNKDGARQHKVRRARYPCYYGSPCMAAQQHLENFPSVL